MDVSFNFTSFPPSLAVGRPCARLAVCILSAQPLKVCTFWCCLLLLVAGCYILAFMSRYDPRMLDAAQNALDTAILPVPGADWQVSHEYGRTIQGERSARVARFLGVTGFVGVASAGSL